MKNTNLDLKSLLPLLLGGLKKSSRYAGLLFFVLVAGVYGFVVLRVNTLSNIQPGSGDTSLQEVSTSIPKVDPKVVEQLETLEDNSVNVQTLFERARDNPFQE